MKTYLAILSCAFLFVCCFSSKHRVAIVPGTTILVDSFPAECPYLTKDNKGNAVLSWVRMINDSTTAFCFATNIDGKSFSSPVVIPNSSNVQPHGENLPKIIFKPNGEIIALWGARHATRKNKHAGSIFYTQSFDSGKTWAEPRLLVNDTASFDQRYYDVALLSDGEVGIIWLDNRKTTSTQGSALYFMKTRGSKGFVENGTLISQPCCPCCRTKLLVDRNGDIHAIYRGILENSIRDMVHIISTDGGNSFSAPERISADNWVINGCPHTGPSMTENEEGIHFAWFTGGKSHGCYYTKSTDNGTSFMMKDSVSAFGSHPQITSIPSGELMIAWEESATVSDKVVKKIGVQIRNAEGMNEGKAFITDANASASFPVLSAMSNNQVAVAYTKEVNNKSFVAFQTVSIR